MSVPNKKLRKQKAQSQMTKRQAAANEEAKNLKAYTLTFWIVMILCVSITIGALAVNPVKNILYRNTTSVQVGDHKINAVEMNYFYVDAINSFTQQYGQYISYMMSTTTPLGEQVYNKETGESWADFFISQAEYNIQSTYAVYDLAMAEGYKLSEEEAKSIDSNISYLSMYASLYGFSNVRTYLTSIYGNGATEDSYREYLEKCAIAESYYNKYYEELEFDADALSAYDTKHPVEFNSYNFAYHYLPIKSFYAEGAGTKGEGDKITYTDAETAAAVEAAKKVAEDLKNGKYATLDEFDAAIDALEIYKEEPKDENKDNTSDKQTKDNDSTTSTESTGSTSSTESTGTGDADGDKEEKPTYKHQSTKQENVLYQNLNSLFRDWIVGLVKDETEGEDKEDTDEEKEPTYVPRTEGEMTVIPYTTGEGDNETVIGYYVIRFGSINDNRTNLVNVRHILIMFKNDQGKTYSDGIKTFTDDQKRKAKLELELIKSDFEKGEKTEAAFEKLAKEKSQDTGSKDNGGLYEDVCPGQMVTNFNDWCFDEARKAGDFDIVETEYGYHLIYFVSHDEVNYRDFMLENALRNETANEWLTKTVEAVAIELVNTKFVNKKMTLA